jgi:quercetin dioxygenase-like cupin family protein
MPAYIAGPDPGEPFAVLADAARTGGALGIVVCTWRAGRTPPPHSMPRTDQAFLVLSGACVFTVDGADRPARTGDLAFVPRGSPMAVRVTDGPCRVLVVLAPAGPEAYLATASALPDLNAATLIALAADHDVIVHLG